MQKNINKEIIIKTAYCSASVHRRTSLTTFLLILLMSHIGLLPIMLNLSYVSLKFQNTYEISMLQIFQTPSNVILNEIVFEIILDA